MRRSFLYALGLTLLVSLWMASGQLFGRAEEAEDAVAETAFPVEAAWFEAQAYRERIRLRGRTEPLRAVTLRSQIEASVERTPVDPGTRVKEGELICKLFEGEIPYRLAEARSLAEARKMEADAAKELQARGNRSDLQTAQAEAAFEAAKAQVAFWEVQRYHTNIRAPFDGLVDDRAAEEGSLLRIGDACALLVQTDPFLAVGELSEDQVARISPGQPAEVRLADGRTLNGRVRFIAATAQDRTRTFRVEVELPNPDGRLRDGLSADIALPVAARTAHLLPAALLVLNTEGALGVRAVDADGRARFLPVEILGDGPDGLWIGGLPQRLRLITAGQNFIIDGEPVRVLDPGAPAGPEGP